MAIYSSRNTSSNNWILSLKLVLISSAVLSMAVVLKLSVPVVADFVASEVPSIWSVALSWLRPPYLYLLINGIIIGIVASSKLQHKVDYSTTPAEVAVPFPTAATEAAAVKVSSGSDAVRTDYAADNGLVSTGYGYDANAAAKVADSHAEDLQRWRDVVEDRVLEAEKTKSHRPPMVMKAGGEAVAPEPAGNALQRKDSLEFSFANENEKPPVCARFAHRKAVKASPEGGKSLGVAKPKRQDTLESTWKMITDGRSMPLTRHLKKADTWETHGRRNAQVDQSSPTPPGAMKKSETFNDHRSGGADSTLSPSSGSGRLRKEPSLSQDELNRRVEAFIKKFNEEMRLQRQESLNQYQEMIRHGGAH